jgi:hypothetical protein
MHFKSLIIHPFLFAIFPIVFIFSYIPEVPINYLALPILLVSVVIFLLLILLKLLFKDSTKAGIMLSFLLILVIGYEYLHTELFGIEIEGINVGSYITLLVPFSIIFVLGIYYLIKTKNKLNNPSTVFNIVSIALIIVVTFYTGIYNLEDPEMKYSKNLEMLLLSDVEQTNLPDIYYIILDGYAGTDSLQKHFNFDNSDFISALSKRGFYMPSISYSNYPVTVLSVPSSLNMQYLNFLGEELGTELTDRHPIDEILQKNLVMKNLKSKGYHIVSFYAGGSADGSTLFVDEKLCGEKHYLNELRDLFVRFTPITYFIPLQSYQDKSYEILCTFSEIPNVKDGISQPIFVYAHMLTPHIPYIFDADGNPVTFSPTTIDQSTEKKFYLEQLKFVNKKVIETVDILLSKSQKTPIIMIQSDHGERTGIDWSNPTKEMIKQGLNNLNAYYLPNDGKNSLYDNITPVNSFRVIFNEYFNVDFELLDDKYYWVKSEERLYDQKDVTEILNEYG